MSGFTTLTYTVEEGVATLTLNRPERLNAINYTTIEEIGLALDRVVEDGARALILTGAGRAFSSGGDLVDGNIDGDIAEPLERLYNPVVEKLFDLPVPVVAAVKGAAAGAGCSLALSADLIIAERSSYFVLSFINIGLVPDAGATWMLPRLIGRARATEIMMLGERVPAEKAEQWGMIYRLVEDGQAIGEAHALARKLAAGPTASYGHLRRSIRASIDGSLTEGLRAERDFQRLAGRTADFKEAVAAFHDKRPPRFIGH